MLLIVYSQNHLYLEPLQPKLRDIRLGREMNDPMFVLVLRIIFWEILDYGYELD